MNQNNGKAIMKNITLAIAAMFVLSACTISNPGAGDKVGQIARINDEGYLCKTTTVLITGKFGGGELTVTIPEYRPDLLEKVKHYNDTQEQVKVTYHTNFIKWTCSNDIDNRMMDSVSAHHEGAAQ